MNFDRKHTCTQLWTVSYSRDKFERLYLQLMLIQNEISNGKQRFFILQTAINPQDCDVCLDIPWSRRRVIHIIQVIACCFIFCCQMSLDLYSTKSDLELGLENSPPKKNTFLILLVSLWGDLFWCSWEFLTAPLLGAQLLILFLHTRPHMPPTALA